MMKKKQSVFDDIMDALYEIDKCQKGKSTLRPNLMNIDANEKDPNLVLLRKIQLLAKAKMEQEEQQSADEQLNS